MQTNTWCKTVLWASTRIIDVNARHEIRILALHSRVLQTWPLRAQVLSIHINGFLLMRRILVLEREELRRGKSLWIDPGTYQKPMRNVVWGHHILTLQPLRWSSILHHLWLAVEIWNPF